MQIQFFEPLSRALNYMAKALFKPFDLGKWFVLGFSAFLANLLEGPGAKGSGNWKGKNFHEFKDIFTLPEIVKDWFQQHPGLAALISAGIVIGVLIFILLTWLSSRGKFMFLDNVLNNRALVTKPWYEFKNEGNSLFLWRIIFGIVSFFAIILWIAFLVFFIIGVHSDRLTPNIGFAFILIASILLIIFAILYIAMFLTDFIVPIMYKNRITAVEAWRQFLPLFSEHWFSFIVYGILKFFLNILVITAVIILGFFTCCLGFLLLIIPYISSVFTLPISFTFRSFSVAFLDQFGPQFKLFPEEENLVAEN